MRVVSYKSFCHVVFLHSHPNPRPCEQTRARRKLEKFQRSSRNVKGANDPLYSAVLSLRSLPISDFCSHNPPAWALPITSMNEDRLLEELGLPPAERNQIEGLQVGNADPRPGGGTSVGPSVEQLSSRAVARLAANPPPEVGRMQRRTAEWLLRPFPLGLRFSGKNMSPLPCWLAGAHCVAINMSNNDLATQLHFALFNGSGGYVLKPPEMRTGGASTAEAAGGADEYWPPPRAELHRTTIEILSLHNLPKVHLAIGPSWDPHL